MLIDDTASAVAEAKNGLFQFPDSKPLKLALIKALCASGSEIEALQQWRSLAEEAHGLLKDRTALEILAWGVLNKGEKSTQLSIKANALIGASMTRDAKAIPLILNAMRGSNSMLRAISIGLAASYGDFPLQDEIKRLLKDEHVWYVRLELIRAVGALRMLDTKDLLFEIIANPRTMAEEKVAATVSLVGLYDTIGDQELVSLIKSNRAGLRELSCQIISHFNLRDKVDLLVPLLQDSHPAVRVSVLNTLALLNIEELGGRSLLEHPRITELLDDPISEVSITASWLALLRGDSKGAKKLQHWVLKGQERQGRLAAGALAISGEAGASISRQLLEKSCDPYIQMTLAIGLIGQRKETDWACAILVKHLLSREKWMWDTSRNPLFRSLSPSRVSLNGQIPNYPEVINQVTRLEILQILCILKYEGAQEAVKKFLSTHTWGVVGAAASTLLEEGDDEALDIVRGLLNDPEEKIRLQAALILAQLGHDKKAIEVLKKSYSQAHREIKIHILQAIAKVGDPDAISFLLDRLNEPFQVLRVVAATAIIQCLYH